MKNQVQNQKSTNRYPSLRSQSFVRRVVRASTHMASAVPAGTRSPPRDLSGKIRMGVNSETGAPVYADLARFERHPHIAFWGAPGVGKTTKIIQMMEHRMLATPRSSWFVFNIKGALGRKVRDMVIANGLGRRLEILDPSDPRRLLRYNPAHQNSLAWSTHAKQLRESIRESTAMSSFDAAQQLGRILFMFLSLTTIFSLTLRDTARLLRPKSELRKQLIPKVPDPDLKAALVYFDSLPDRRQDEIATSSLARIESFAFDPLLKQITCSPGPSFDMGEAMCECKITIFDIREYDPLRTDDARQLLRFAMNDVAAHVFARLTRGEELTPCYVVADEAPEYITTDITRALAMGREPGLHVWLAAQFPDQFLLEDGNPRIRDAVMGCIENHLVFRLANVKACKGMAEQIFFDRFSTKILKHELTGLEQESHLEMQTSYTKSRGASEGQAVAYPESTSVADMESSAQGKSRGTSLGMQKNQGISQAQGSADTKAEAEAHATTRGSAISSTESESSMQGVGESLGAMDAQGSVANDAMSSGVSTVWDGIPIAPMMPNSLTYSSQHASGVSASDVSATNAATNSFASEGRTSSEGITQSEADTDIQSRARAHTNSETRGQISSGGISLAMSEATSESATKGKTLTKSNGITPSKSHEENWSESESTGPMLIPSYRRVPIQQTFFTEDEQILEYGKCIYTLPDQMYFMKLAGARAPCVHADTWAEPTVTEDARQAALEPVYERPWYPTGEVVEAQEQVEGASSASRTHASEPADGETPNSPDPDSSSAATQESSGRPSFWT